MPLLNDLALKSFDGNRTYDEVAHFVHVLIIEPHPLAPDPSPYTGELKEAELTTIRQPLSYADRVAVGAESALLLAGDQLLVVDDLEPGVRVNPIWCTYGTLPNAAFLIRRDGTIQAAWTWLDVEALEAALDALLGA